MAAATHGATPAVEDDFLALVYADAQLLRAEFDAIIAAGWPSSRPPATPAASSWTTTGHAAREPAPPGDRAARGRPRPPGGALRGRQRSPP